MKYFYNYSFLDKWMEANRKITNKQIMKAMGTTSNACLDSWIRKKSPLPTSLNPMGAIWIMKRSANRVRGRCAIRSMWRE